MADWKDDLREGSFRGTPFFISSHEFSFGRRKVDHEFPSKEESNSEDIGRSIRRFNINLYILGDDYFDDRDDLIAALEEEGPGELVHPYLGSKFVQVGVVSMTEDVREGRLVRFNVEFVEAGEPKFPAGGLDAFGAALAAINGVLDTAEGAVNAALDVANAPARVIDELAGAITDTADRVQDIARSVGTVAQGIADVGFAVRKIKGSAQRLARTPSDLATQFRDAIGLLFNAVEDTIDLARSLSLNLSQPQDDFEIVTEETPTTRKIRGNSVAFNNYIVELSISEQARATLNGNYVSVNEAVNVRDLLADDIQAQLLRIGENGDDDLFQNLRNLRAQTIAALPPAELGSLVTFTPPIALPALVISYDLFQSTAKEQEIIDENEVRHPGFVPEGVEIRVSNG